jgi:hypothetical protein
VGLTDKTAKEIFLAAMPLSPVFICERGKSPRQVWDLDWGISSLFSPE